jgi:hypothetical protein
MSISDIEIFLIDFEKKISFGTMIFCMVIPIRQIQNVEK